MIASPSTKRKGDIYIGFLASESNPPNIMEFLAAVHSMAQCLLDKVLYGVVDDESGNSYFADTRAHRLSMAEIAASIYSPLVEVFDACDVRSMSCEEAAFRLFDLNPDLRFSLYYLSPFSQLHDQARTIKRLATNVGMRLHGFDPAMHKVVAAFYENPQGQRTILEGSAKRFAEEELLGVHYFKGHGVELPGGKTADEMVLDAIRNRSFLKSVLLPRNVAQYISDHHDYRKQLTDYLSAKLGLIS